MKPPPAGTPLVDDTFIPVFSTSQTTGGYQITLNGFSFKIDATSGAILSISHPSHGLILDSSSERASLFSLSIPTPDFYPLSADVTKSTMEPVVWQARNGRRGFRLWWKNLAYANARHDKLGTSVPIQAMVEISEGPTPTSVEFRMWVSNLNSQVRIEKVLFPDFRGIRDFAAPAQPTALITADNIENKRFHPFQSFQVPSGRTPFYASAMWERVKLKNTPASPVDYSRDFVVLRDCSGPSLYFSDLRAANEASLLQASEIIYRRDQLDGKLKLAWVRPTDIAPPGSFEGGSGNWIEMQPFAITSSSDGPICK